MNLSKLEYVVTIAETKNISKAAAQLYISQPALTKYLNKLEEELGVKLFDRSVSPIRLTYAGEWYVGEARKLLAIHRRMDRDLEDILHMRRGRLVVGMGITRSAYWMPHILPRFLQACPGIEVRIEEGSNSYLERGLHKGTIDLVFHALPVGSPDLDYEPIIDEPILLVIPRQHPLLKNRDTEGNSPTNPLYIEPALLNGQKFIGMVPGNGLYNTVQQIFDRYGIKPGSVIQMVNCDTVYMLATEGIGIAFVPDSCAVFPAYYKRPVFCTVDCPPFTRKQVAVYRKDLGISPAARKFIELTVEAVHHNPYLQVR